MCAPQNSACRLSSMQQYTALCSIWSNRYHITLCIYVCALLCPSSWIENTNIYFNRVIPLHNNITYFDVYTLPMPLYSIVLFCALCFCSSIAVYYIQMDMFPSLLIISKLMFVIFYLSHPNRWNLQKKPDWSKGKPGDAKVKEEAEGVEAWTSNIPQLPLPTHIKLYILP